MRHSRTHRILAVLTFALLTFVLVGCPKKTPPPVTTKPSVSTKTEPAGKTPGKTTYEEPMTSPTKDVGGQMAQIAAMKGEDIPLKELPKKQFFEPTPTEKDKFKNVYFDYDKSDIKPEYRPVLEGIAQWMKDNSNRQLLVEGHCDERGTNEYNLALGERRALSVRRYLVALGTHPERISTISYGEEKPVDLGHTEEAWAKNRRAEFKLSAKE